MSDTTPTDEPHDNVCPDCKGSGASECAHDWTDEDVDVDEVIRHHDEEHAGKCPSCGGTGDRPTVTDEQVDAALNTLWPNEPHMDESRHNVRAALEAAAAVKEKP